MFLIVGFTKRTSYSLAKYLSKQKQSLIISDQSNTVEQQELLQELSQDTTTIINELGNQHPSLLNMYPVKKIFLSPGVPRSIPLIQEALALNIEVLNDIEYFYQLFPYRQYIAITGTDGKTTVTTWLQYVLSSKYLVVAVGNIGIPIFEYTDARFDEYLFIVELSSFQLESITTFKARISLITNIHEDHLDRYNNMNEYALAKKKVFSNQSIKDIALINDDDDYLKIFTNDITAKKYFFSFTKKSDVYYSDGMIYLDEKPILQTKLLSVVGEHNIQNALMVLVIADILQIDINIIREKLCSFKGVEHRLEFVAKINEIEFYNDSKATTIQALSKALSAFDKKIILLAGGQSKGLNYKSLSLKIHEKTKQTISFGELSETLKNTWGSDICLSFSTLEQAFNKAVEIAKSGDIILLSPGAASFDEFVSFEQRGYFFKELVAQYTHTQKEKI